MEVADLRDHPVPIRDLPDQLLAAGIHAFTAQDAARAAGISMANARPALARLLANHLAFSPARGLYIPIPPQYRSWGAVPATWFVDTLMKHLGRAYYVGLLSAAELHGAAHQRPQAFQVMVDRDLRDRTFGRIQLQFFTNKLVSELPTERVNTPTGTIRIASPELTVLDLASRPDTAGGLSNLATVLVELVELRKLHSDRIVPLVDQFPRAASRRLGWLLEHAVGSDATNVLGAVGTRGEPSQLDPYGPRRGSVDPRWRVRVNTEIEPDR